MAELPTTIGRQKQIFERDIDIEIITSFTGKYLVRGHCIWGGIHIRAHYLTAIPVVRHTYSRRSPYYWGNPCDRKTAPEVQNYSWSERIFSSSSSGNCLHVYCLCLFFGKNVFNHNYLHGILLTKTF